MKTNLEKIIQIACLQNNGLKTVIKARHKLKTDIRSAISLINELVAVNANIDKTPNKFDEILCDRSEEVFTILNKLDVYRNSALLSELLDHHDQELVHGADDLIDLIDETKGLIIARRNPLKGIQYSPIPK